MYWASSILGSRIRQARFLAVPLVTALSHALRAYVYVTLNGLQYPEVSGRSLRKQQYEGLSFPASELCGVERSQAESPPKQRPSADPFLIGLEECSEDIENTPSVQHEAFATRSSHLSSKPYE
jgi:hypothetical protein